MYIVTKVVPSRLTLSCLGPVVFLLLRQCFTYINDRNMFIHNYRVSKRYDGIGMSSIGGFILEVAGWQQS